MSEAQKQTQKEYSPSDAEKPYELSELLDRGGIVLVDTSAQAREHNSVDFLTEIYGTRKPADIPTGLISACQDSIEGLLTVLEHPNAQTITEVSDELRGFYLSLGKVTSYFSKNMKPKKYGKSRNREYEKQDSATMRELQELHDLAFKAWTVAKQKKFCTDKTGMWREDYERLSKMVILLTKTIGLKDSNGAYDIEGVTKDPYASVTDEKLVAALLCLSLHGEKNPAIITDDIKHIPRILGPCSSLIGCDEFLPYNENYRTALRDNSFQLYLKHFSDHTFRESGVMGSLIHFPKEFLLHRAPKRSAEAKEEIRELWKQFGQLKNGY